MSIRKRHPSAERTVRARIMIGPRWPLHGLVAVAAVARAGRRRRRSGSGGQPGPYGTHPDPEQ